MSYISPHCHHQARCDWPSLVLHQQPLLASCVEKKVMLINGITGHPVHPNYDKIPRRPVTGIGHLKFRAFRPDFSTFSQNLYGVRNKQVIT